LFVDVPLSYRTDRRVYLGKDAVRIEALGERMRQLMLNRSDKQAFLRTDGKLTVQDQIDVLEALKQAGVENVGIVTRLPGEQ
jgi:biopolymer transport protein ExbD